VAEEERRGGRGERQIDKDRRERGEDRGDGNGGVVAGGRGGEGGT